MKNLILLVTLLGAVSWTPALAQGRGGRAGGPPQPPATPRGAAPVDLTGYWVSVVTEDWRYRMVMPARGDYQGVPLTPAARKIADSWDAAREAASGEPCKAYGAPALLRVPGRLHITWQDDETLKQKVASTRELMEAYAVLAFHRAATALPDGAPGENEKINPYAVSLDPDRWEADGLFNGEGLSLAEARQTPAAGMENLFMEAIATPA